MLPTVGRNSRAQQQELQRSEQQKNYINRRLRAVKENIRGRQQQGARSGGNNINRRDFNHIWDASNSRDDNNSREATTTGKPKAARMPTTAWTARNIGNTIRSIK
jgi:hypothetical protein